MATAAFQHLSIEYIVKNT